MRQEKVLRYNCGARFFAGHNCRSKIFLLFTQDEDVITLGTDAFSHGLEHTEPSSHASLSNLCDYTNESGAQQISLHAMEGHTSPKTIRNFGTIQNTKLLY